jgi:hypothetical protein
MRETMPKNPPQDKKTMSKKGSSPAYRRVRVTRRAPVQSVARIMKEQGWMQGLQQVRGQQQEWLQWFRAALPHELSGSIVNVVRKGEELTLLASSSGWSARLRFALDPLMEKLKERAPDIVKVRVRVTPQSGSAEKMNREPGGS